MLRVLVVDDHTATAESLASLLRQWGHEALTASDGPSALDLAADFHPDAALVDIVMPGLDGYEVAHRLRELPGLHDVLLIAMTGFGRGQGRLTPEGDFDRGQGRLTSEGDFDLHLLKPLDPDDLRRILAECPGPLAR